MLDKLRLGKIELCEEVLDILFESIDMLRAIVASKAEDAEAPSPREVEDLATRLEKADFGSGRQDSTDLESCVGVEILAVLTEYEEHRLHENIKEGMHIIKMRAAFSLATFDEDLTELQAIAKSYGEIITTLPSAEESSDDKITFDIIIGSSGPIDEVQEALAGRSVKLSRLREGTISTPAEGPEAAPKKPAPEKPAAPKAGPAAASPPSPELVMEEVEGDRQSTLRTISQTVRVDIGKLDNLMNIVGELVISKNVTTQLIDRLRGELGFNELVMELIKNTRTMERKLAELQGGVLEVRMVPVGQIFDKLHRNVRKLSRELGKEVEFRAEGGDTELDKLIIEELADPLMHIIRNSMDHGLESKAERIQLGKPKRGLIKLSAFQRGNHVVIEVYDDGGGLDFDRIREKAIERGMVEPGGEPRKEELVELLFTPGFSTAESVSEISGRGVGLDVVKSNISELSGAIDIESRPGEGTNFIITMPITLAIIQALIVETARQTFAIPLNSVQQGLIVRPREIQTIEGREVIELRGKTLPLLRLDKLFGLSDGNGGRPGAWRAEEEGGRKLVLDAEEMMKDLPLKPTEMSEVEEEEDIIYVVKVGIAERGMGIIVDKLWGRQDIVIKPVGEILRGIRGIAGATELGNQRAILVLDVMDLMDEAAVSVFSAGR